MTTHRRPNVFIGCSREAIHYARAVSAQLEYHAQVNPWYAGTFQANDFTMEALERELDANDFAVFIFAADDVALIRQKPVFITRDNTVFEMGLFWGRLGRKRVFAIIPRDLPSRSDLIANTDVSEFHVLSDLAGLTLLSYGQRTDGKYAAAVDNACGEILSAIQKEELFKDPRVELERKQSVLHFFWEYNRNLILGKEVDRYAAFAEAIRNSLLTPSGFRVTGAAIWKQIGNRIMQVGGNVGRGRTFRMDDNERKGKEEQRIYLLDVLNGEKWTFFKRREIAEVYVLCYPLSNKHALSVHIAGNRTLSHEHLTTLVEVHNDELLMTINDLVGGIRNE
ncbi:putative nucleotide-binding protein [Paenibacillus phyllosphaerae]|uniref:Putative nucleotide-binding protein n=1 Tax=Paenibacillus phyllosphaerae TaxID=274593 RepID=A0A7W5B1N3_9BACL|nr:TIR domain-containing protein [Paenibacillus phyllosphaerae]MBB3112790.1 putative nucleotide-binding protein [Paenibacillus phyllosphaerae]